MRGDAAAHVTPVHLVGRQRLQQAHPLDAVVGRELALAVGQQILAAHVEDPAGHVAALQIAAQADEFVGRIVTHGAGEQSRDALAAPDDALQIVVPAAPAEAGVQPLAGEQVQIRDLFPDLARHHIARGAQVLARQRDGVQQRARMLRMREQKMHHRRLRVLADDITVDLVVAGDRDQGLPAEGDRTRQVQLQVGVHRDQPGGVLGALGIAAEPVHVVRDAGKQAAHADGSSTIQVSLLPPPWEEFTTSEPARIATRVRPPVVT